MLKKMLLLGVSAGLLVALMSPVAQATTITDTYGEPSSSATLSSTNFEVEVNGLRLVCDWAEISTPIQNGSQWEPASLLYFLGWATSASELECPVLDSKGSKVTGAFVTSIAGYATLYGGSGTANMTVLYDVTVSPGVTISCELSISGFGAALKYTAGGSLTLKEAHMLGGGSLGCPITGTLNTTFDLDGSIDG